MNEWRIESINESMKHMSQWDNESMDQWTKKNIQPIWPYVTFNDLWGHNPLNNIKISPSQYRQQTFI